jgi:Flp pilus assembly protein TadD
MIALEAAANLLHDDPQLDARIGQALLANGMNEQAVDRFRAAVAGGFAPDDVLRSMALAFCLHGLFAESERTVGSVDNDANRDKDVVRGLLLIQRRNFPAAEGVLGPVAGLRPNEPAILNLLASALYNQARYQEAVDLLERAEELDPTIEGVAANLAVARAARSAELLAENATPVRAAPTR